MGYSRRLDKSCREPTTIVALTWIVRSVVLLEDGRTKDEDEIQQQGPK